MYLFGPLDHESSSCPTLPLSHLTVVSENPILADLRPSLYPNSWACQELSWHLELQLHPLGLILPRILSDKPDHSHSCHLAALVMQYGRPCACFLVI